MVFSSIPAYLDPPNWHHLQSHPPNHQQEQQFGGVSSTGWSTQLLPPPPPPYSGGGGGAGSVRPGSMTDRARMANIPMPEAALKCPRCESTNTKFCYFNNYSLSQPRHFCKTCRRYWTRGGALRSVPVGGGCRRNKRTSTKPSSSKSPAASGDRQTCSSSSATSVTSTGTADHALGLGSPALRYMMAPLHNFADLSSGEFGLNYGVLSNNDLNFHSVGVTSTTGTPLLASLRGSVAAESSQQWRQQQTHSQFSFLGGGLDPPPLAAELLYPYDHQGGHVESQSSTFVGQLQNQVRPKAPATSGVVKMEDDHNHKQHQNQNQDELSLSRQLLGNITGNEQFWSGVGANAWNDLSGFSSSSTSHP